MYLDPKRTFLIRVKRGGELHTHRGVVRHDDLIGKQYGEAVASSMGARFVALKPTVRDYAMKMARRTQIIYPKDASLVILHTGIGPGSRVVEAGTGSGALACYLAHFVKPDGKVYSYEVRGEFVKLAQKNIERAGLSQYIEVKRKDITKGIDERDVDAVVLDLATPWEVIPHAYEALRGSGSFASFSPTIDQVVKTVEELDEHGFVDIVTVESLLRRLRAIRGQTRPETLMIGHTGYLVFARKAIVQSSELEF